MKQVLESLIRQALSDLVKSGELAPQEAFADDFQPSSLKINLDVPKDKQHGDFASNIAMVSSKVFGKAPREIAGLLTGALAGSKIVERTEIAGPGFINFYIRAESRLAAIPNILAAADRYGHSRAGKGKKIQVEFVSANPTGPLHVGHGRGAAYGASLSALLAATGHEVVREYYVNDAGRQMSILAVSLWLRYLAILGESFTFPVNGYKGDYLLEIAQQFADEHGERFQRPASKVFAGIAPDEPQGGDKEQHIDALIARCREMLGEEQYEVLFNTSLDAILADIADDLGEFGVQYDRWFSEASVASEIPGALALLRSKGHVYEQDGALWFRSTSFGDDKDRVVQRDNGEYTYFASDIAYHKNKFDRGFHTVINVWGADHHGYITRVKAALTALGLDAERLVVKLVQFAILYRGEERVQMSTRSGSFVTLRELREEVGNDAARFVYVARKTEQHMDFDLELAKSETKDNPVYYVQYAHARISQLWQKVPASVAERLKQTDWTSKDSAALLEPLTEDAELALVAKLAAFPEVIEVAAQNYEPHTLAHYLRELASEFHGYYNGTRVIVDEEPLVLARLALAESVAQVIRNGLAILGVNAPESM
ncbi:arginine--tRNA ligase [Allohahella marinimesophila]|uniref:Arginine--tRNA ligase n=1 Tax=Allohahella marinimesophila TaxID=1054972 RepID=A0ABP7PL40_9GAMM